MRRLVILIVGLPILALWLPAAAQQTAEPDTAPAAAVEEDSDADDEAAADEVDDSDLDLQTYEEDEDDFVPTEEIPADEAIPFPTDI